MKGMTKQTAERHFVCRQGCAGNRGRQRHRPCDGAGIRCAGACVVIADTAVDGGHMTAALIVEAGGKALFVKANVTVAAEVEALVERPLSITARIDCAVNGAAVEDRIPAPGRRRG